MRDLDGDGVREILHVTLDGIESLRVDSSWTVTQLSFTPGGGGKEAALGDLNGDHKVDVVASDGPQVAVSLNNGDGTFAPPRFYEATAGWMKGIAIGDADGDGRLDIAIAGAYNETSILYGTCH